MSNCVTYSDMHSKIYFMKKNTTEKQQQNQEKETKNRTQINLLTCLSFDMSLLFAYAPRAPVRKMIRFVLFKCCFILRQALFFCASILFICFCFSLFSIWKIVCTFSYFCCCWCYCCCCCCCRFVSYYIAV